MIRKLISRLPFVITFTYKDIFQRVDKDEENTHTEEKLIPLKDNIISAMICCYINHEKIMQYLSTNAREQVIDKLNNKIYETKNLLNTIIQDKKELDKQIKNFEYKYNIIAQKNKETDSWLNRQLEDINRRYGNVTTPDFCKKDNLISTDIIQLKEIEKKLKDNGINPFNTEDKDSALKDCEKFVTEIGFQLNFVRKEIEENINIIKKWMCSNQYPPAKNKNDENYYCLPDKICLYNYADWTDKRPVIITHKNQPLIFRYTDEWEISNVITFIREIWNGFSKISPINLIDVFIVDTSERIEGQIDKDLYDETTDEGNLSHQFCVGYQNGYEKLQNAVTNEQNTSVLYH